jgi:hypothetical protein
MVRKLITRSGLAMFTCVLRPAGNTSLGSVDNTYRQRNSVNSHGGNLSSKHAVCAQRLVCRRDGARNSYTFVYRRSGRHSSGNLEMTPNKMQRTDLRLMFPMRPTFIATSLLFYALRDGAKSVARREHRRFDGSHVGSWHLSFFGKLHHIFNALPKVTSVALTLSVPRFRWCLILITDH